MRARVDEQGQITIPPEILQQAGIGPGEEVEVEIQDGHIELVPENCYARLEIRDGWPVITVPPGTPPVTTEEVNDFIDRIRTGELD